MTTLGGPRYAHLLALFWLCPQLSIPKNVQHQLNMDWAGQRYRSSECQLGCTCCLGQWFSNCVLKNSRCCKEVSLGVTMVVKEDACGSFQAPHSCFIYSSSSFTLGFHIVFIQRASWSQSLWKTNDLRISCSQNAEIQKIGHRNQKLWAKPVVSQEGVFLVILSLIWATLKNEVNIQVCYTFWWPQIAFVNISENRLLVLSDNSTGFLQSAYICKMHSISLEILSQVHG